MYEIDFQRIDSRLLLAMCVIGIGLFIQDIWSTNLLYEEGTNMFHSVISTRILEARGKYRGMPGEKFAYSAGAEPSTPTHLYEWKSGEVEWNHLIRKGDKHLRAFIVILNYKYKGLVSIIKRDI